MAIQIIHQSATADGLESVGPVGLPMSEPPCLLKSATRQIPGKRMFGPACGNARSANSGARSPRAKSCILTGRCTFTPDSAP